MYKKKPICGILAGEPEIIGERCADGGKCHHRCTDTCSRRATCAPLSGSGLRFDWSPVDPSLSGLRDAAIATGKWPWPPRAMRGTLSARRNCPTFLRRGPGARAGGSRATRDACW